MQPWTWAWALLFSLFTSTSHAVSANRDNQTVQLPSSDPSLSDLISSSNASILRLPSNDTLFLDTELSSDEYEYTCDGELYGTNLRLDDCMSALESFSNKGRNRITFANRDIAHFNDKIYILPWRWMGAGAGCYFEPILKPGARTGSTTLSTLRDAAYAVTSRCASREGKGGKVTNLGGDNNVELIVGKYHPRENAGITCMGEMAQTSQCPSILGYMFLDKDDLKYGPRSDPNRDQTLPWQMITHDSTCVVRLATINREGKSDTSSWYKLWEAANAVYYACVRKGYHGSIRGIGNNGDLLLSMVTPPKPAEPAETVD